MGTTIKNGIAITRLRPTEGGGGSSIEFIKSVSAETTPEGVSWKDGATTITGTLAASASTIGKIYLVRTGTKAKDVYEEYVTTEDGGVYSWERLGQKVEVLSHPYISLERLKDYLYRVTFDSLPAEVGNGGAFVGGCSSFVKDGKLHRSLDFNYDNSAEFIVVTKDFEGMAFITGLNDGAMNDSKIAQLPYRVNDGQNRYGISMATHVLFNDWQWTGAGDKSIALTKLPYLVLSNVRSMATIADDLDGILDNVASTEGLDALGYLLQIIVTDGTTTYAIMPPLTDGEGYVLQDISSNPKMTNFRWVADETVERADLQTRPTGVERFNMMPCALSELRFTKAYEAPDRLSEFIGINDTDKDSTDAELEAIYDLARAKYLTRTRNGETWQSLHAAVYGDGIEELYVQEDYDSNLAKYEKPSSGIPESDLSQTVKDKLNLKEVIYGYYYEGAFYEESTHETLITPASEREYVDLEGNVPYIWKDGEYVAIGGGGGGGDVICDIDDTLASVLLRWPLLGLSIKSLVRDYPSLADGLLAHPDLAPQYVASKDVLDENEGLDASVAAYPALVSALASTPEIGAVIVANEGLDAVVAAYPSVASLLVANPSLVPSVIQYPAVAKAMAKWPALAPVLVSEPRYIPYLAEDEIIAHSLVETGRRAWLVGDGTAYINTGLYQLEWPLKVKTNVAYNTNTEMYLGGNYSSGSNGSRVGIASSKHTMYSGSNYQPISTAVVLKQEYAVEFEFSGLTGKKMTVDGAVNENTSAANKVGANNLPFGFFSGKGNAVSNNLNGRISDADLTIGESTYHYIPAMYGGKYGYLETTTMEFKGNNNTSGQFYAMTTIKNNG